MKFLYILPSVFILFFSLGCSMKKHQLFQEDTTEHKAEYQQIKLLEPKQISVLVPYAIKAHDRLSVVFFSYPELSTKDRLSGANSNGIEVPSHGEVLFPLIGKVQVIGLTKDQLKGQLYKKYSLYLEKDPTMIIEILNQKVYVLGEVRNSGPIDFTKQSSLTPIKAIVEAGGMTQYSASDKVMIIRGNREDYKIIKLNLTSLDSIRENNTMLQPDDIVYVSHSKMKDLTMPLNGINPATALINTLFQTIYLYRTINN